MVHSKRQHLKLLTTELAIPIGICQRERNCAMAHIFPGPFAAERVTTLVPAMPKEEGSKVSRTELCLRHQPISIGISKPIGSSGQICSGQYAVPIAISSLKALLNFSLKASEVDGEGLLAIVSHQASGHKADGDHGTSSASNQANESWLLT